jgi:hypothetical protein
MFARSHFDEMAKIGNTAAQEETCRMFFVRQQPVVD